MVLPDVSTDIDEETDFSKHDEDGCIKLPPSAINIHPNTEPTIQTVRAYCRKYKELKEQVMGGRTDLLSYLMSPKHIMDMDDEDTSEIRELVEGDAKFHLIIADCCQNILRGIVHRLEITGVDADWHDVSRWEDSKAEIEIAIGNEALGGYHDSLGTLKGFHDMHSEVTKDLGIEDDALKKLGAMACRIGSYMGDCLVEVREALFNEFGPDEDE